jgi:hypothetical protein
MYSLRIITGRRAERKQIKAVYILTRRIQKHNKKSAFLKET